MKYSDNISIVVIHLVLLQYDQRAEKQRGSMLPAHAGDQLNLVD